MATKANDFTSIIESVAKDESKFLADLLKEELASVRPVGSERVPQKEQEAEWMFMKDNPEALAKFFADQNASVASAIEYAHKMMQKEQK